MEKPREEKIGKIIIILLSLSYQVHIIVETILYEKTVFTKILVIVILVLSLVMSLQAGYYIVLNKSRSLVYLACLFSILIIISSLAPYRYIFSSRQKTYILLSINMMIGLQAYLYLACKVNIRHNIANFICLLIIAQLISTCIGICLFENYIDSEEILWHMLIILFLFAFFDAFSYIVHKLKINRGGKTRPI